MNIDKNKDIKSEAASVAKELYNSLSSSNENGKEDSFITQLSEIIENRNINVTIVDFRDFFRGDPEILSHIKKHNVVGLSNPALKQIYIDRNATAAEKRFTLAHEIGHVILHSSENRVFCNDNQEQNKKNPKELEASSFAYELLMPIEQIKIAYEISKSLSILANLFGVPKSKMKQRLNYLKELGEI